MSFNNQSDFYGEPFLPDFNQAYFRHYVARLFRLIIRARLKCDPDFIGNDVLARWNLMHCATDTSKASKLLRDADRTLELLNNGFLIRSTSGGYPIDIDTSRPAGRILAMVTRFADSLDGGDIIHRHSLIVLAKKLEAGDCIDWNDMQCWDELEQLRNDLDLLPTLDEPEGNAAIEPENIFRWEDSEWVIKYKGVKRNVRSMVGLYYIWQLLQSCDRTMTANNMRSQYRIWSGKLPAVDGYDPDISYNRFVYENDNAIGKGVILSRLQEIKTKLNDTDGRLSANDKKKLEEEKLILVNGLRECGGSDYEQFRKHYKKDQDQVRNNINTALRKLKDIMPSLYKHLMSSIRMGPEFSYQPESPKNWAL